MFTSVTSFDICVGKYPGNILKTLREREWEREVYSHKCRQNQKGKRPSVLVPMIVTM